MSKTPDLLTTADARLILGVSIRQVNRLAASGRLPVAVKLPGPRGANLYRRADVEKLAKRGVAA